MISYPCAVARGHSRRMHLAPLALAAVLSFSPAAQSATRTWASGDGWFFDPARWHQNLVPSNYDEIHIGNLAAAAGATVTMGGQWGVSHDGLFLSNGVTLDTNGSELISFGLVMLNGAGTRLIARPAPYLNQADLQGQIHLGVGTHLELRDNVEVTWFNNAVSHGEISGRGLVVVGPGFSNNGVIRPGNNGGLVINAGQIEPNLMIDLDGWTGTSQLLLTNPFAQLQVNAGFLQDSFGGQISMVPGALLDMRIASGWAADTESRITVLGMNNASASQIAGSHFTFGGELGVGLAEGKLRVLAPMTVQSTARIDVGHSDELVFQGATTVQGGNFVLGRFGTMTFEGATVLQGGSFSTHSTHWGDGTIAFNGATTWRGVVTLAGTARQQGTATVSGFSGATIHADRFDMDGLSGTTTWNVNAPLAVHAQQIGTTASNRFGGTLNIAGGITPRLTMQLTDPNASWIMSGTLNLSGLTHLVESKIAGSRMVVEGDVNVAGGRVRIDADTRFSDASFAGPAVVSFGDAAAELWMAGTTQVDAGTQFEGEGTLHNAASGHLWLAHGASLGQVGLVNRGQLDVGTGAGAASVHNFAQLGSGSWTVELGGEAPGTEHDLLTVFGGGAQLDGLLRVALIDLGGGTFTPGVGDEFTILLAPGGVSGSFQNSPVSVANGWIYNWTVLYRNDEVRLQLASIAAVPEPGTWAMWLAGLAATGAMARRRRPAR